MTDQVFSAIESITDEEIARVREMIDEPVRLQQYCSEASLDTIRHFAMGVGDENPLWCDEEYAAVGPYEGLVAPPLFPYSIFAPGVTPGFGGLQVFFGTAKWTFQRPIRRGEKVSATARMTDLSERQGRTASRMLVQESKTDYAVDDEVVATVISEALRVQSRRGRRWSWVRGAGAVSVLRAGVGGHRAPDVGSSASRLLAALLHGCRGG